MKTRHWILVLVVVAVGAFALGRYLSTLKKAYTDREKIAAGIDVVSGLNTLLG